MKRSISTHVFLQQRLHAGLLDAMVAAGAQSIELFAARHHFDYTDRAEVKELAKWFRSNDCRATLHQPIFESRASDWSRHVPATINLIDVEKSRRIDAMDEVKRALEAAEQIDIDSIVLHLGTANDTWSERSLDLSMTAVEHIKAFAHPLGVKTLVETLHNDVTTPEHLKEMLRIAHLDTVHVCLDIGHVNLHDMGGVESAFAVLGDRIRELHLHDNQGEKDEHLWPGEGTVDWDAVRKGVAGLKHEPVGTLEIAYEPEIDAKAMSAKAAKAFAMLEEPVRN
ncbi:sugar phosphate isomerase/epimerase family protein [Terriglobus sp. TAA 43]|uniref:sugar phosphate isomerase/epimerase family protein n=1 Tax=Terriglobus sp. TAA 43 TaxID=278961 RepID=UPI0006469BCC|nr:sugar phosphate isomerase/epimerase family protein [Terriglobus sp. TAA 43]